MKPEALLPGPWASGLVLWGLMAGGAAWWMPGRIDPAVLPVVLSLMAILPVAALYGACRRAGRLLARHLEAAASREREAVRRSEELATASDLKTRFIANISHELRTPLTSIVSYTSMLGDGIKGPITPEQQELLSRVAAATGALQHLIDDLLDISRIEAGKLTLTIGLVALEECVEAAFAVVEPQLRARGLAFRTELPDEVIYVNGSFHRLQQVFVNLLSNALKFTEKGEIGVSVRRVDGRAEARVWDTGPGIPAEHLPHIFDEFSQGDDSIRRRYGGSGLGLAICRKLVTLHEGEISVEPHVPQGTVFTVTLPVARRN